MNEEVEKYLGLVVYVMNKEFKYFLESNSGYREDLYQEGCIGLWRGMKNYDESKGTHNCFFSIPHN
jgi:DNA-directed RNA polymerase specialized sigma subunit